MADSEGAPEHEHHSKRAMLGGLMKEGAALGKEEMLKGKLMLEHSLGLGAKPNIIPAGEAIIHGEERTVEIGWHPVLGLGGKWFAEKTGLGKKITEKIHKYPDPTQHWAVLAGEYCHELWMDEHLNVIYMNEKIDKAQWHTFVVGKTRFNDEALRQASEMVIYKMREKRAEYNLISNNCQNFAVLLLDAIQIGAHQEFGTAFAVYQRATGHGRIQDLFATPPEEEQQQVSNGLQHQSTVQVAQQVMEENTTKLDNHHSFFH